MQVPNRCPRFHAQQPPYPPRGSPPRGARLPGTSGSAYRRKWVPFRVESTPILRFAQPNRGLLRVEEAAEWLGLSRTKAYKVVYRGMLPSVTIGRSRRVPMAAL